MVDPTFESINAMKKFLSESSEEIANIMGCLSHYKRIEILSGLLDEEKPFKELMTVTNLQRSSLGNHLLRLVDKGLVQKLDRGIYRLTANGQDLIESIAYRYLDAKIREQLRLEKLHKENLKIFDQYTTMGQKPDEVIGMKTRKILDGIEKVSFAPKEGNYEFTPFPQCLKACMAFLGDPYTYEYIMGTSGAAFRLMWRSDRWEGGNVDIMFMSEDPGYPIKRALDSVGLDMQFIVNQGWKSDPDWPFPSQSKKVEKNAMKEYVIEKITTTNTPLLGFGVVGPPECSIITGYDDHGEILVGWSLFQDMVEVVGQSKEEVTFEDSGYFRKSNWFKDTYGIIALDNNKEKPPLNEIYRSSLEWALEVIRRPKVKEFHNGLMSYTIWADKLQDDNEFPKDDFNILAERKMVHYDAMTMVSERFQASKFLKQMAEHDSFKKAEPDLLKAAKCFEEEWKCMAEWWKIVGKIWDDEKAQITALANSETRRKFVPIILKARENDEAGANYIEKAISKI